MQFISTESLTKSLKELSIKDDLEKISIERVMNRYLKGNSSDRERIESKNNILVHLIDVKKMTKAPEIHIRNQCKSCNGRGFNLEFFTVEEVKCVKCNGTGWKISLCKKCDATGRIGEIDCFKCKGRGTYLYKKTEKYEGIKCLVCMGKGKIKKIVQRDTEIKSVSECKKCDGTGIQKLGTSVISGELGKKLKQNLSLTK